MPSNQTPARDRSITAFTPISADPQEAAQPRARGEASICVRSRDGQAALRDLRQAGSLKLLFPRTRARALTGVLLNTAGGVTGGDSFVTRARCEDDAHLVLTTQAAERAYRAQPGQTGKLRTKLTAERAARIDWLPQETILFDESALDRRLSVRMDGQSRVLIVEPLVLGRAAMGETLTNIDFRDRIEIVRDGTLLLSDRTRLDSTALQALSGRATAAGMRAMATVILAAQDAERFLDAARTVTGTECPCIGGASLIRDGLLFARLVAPDSFELRRMLVPLAELLAETRLPKTWTI